MVIGEYIGKQMMEVRAMRKDWGIIPTYKMVDTCAAEFEAETPYYYSTYAVEDEVRVSDKKEGCCFRQRTDPYRARRRVLTIALYILSGH